MTVTQSYTGTVTLVDRKTRVVSVLGPEPLGSRGPRDRHLLFKRRSQTTLREFLSPPQSVGYCYQADGRRARFLVDKGPDGDALLDVLARHPKTPTRLARPYGPKGWVVEG